VARVGELCHGDRVYRTNITRLKPDGSDSIIATLWESVSKSLAFE